MIRQQHEKVIKESFGYEIERDIHGTLWLLQTDPTGRVVYHKVRLFQEGWGCGINNLINALCTLKAYVKNLEERKHLAIRILTACEDVSWNIYWLIQESIENKRTF